MFSYEQTEPLLTTSTLAISDLWKTVSCCTAADNRAHTHPRLHQLKPWRTKCKLKQLPQIYTYSNPILSFLLLNFKQHPNKHQFVFSIQQQAFFLVFSTHKASDTIFSLWPWKLPQASKGHKGTKPATQTSPSPWQVFDKRCQSILRWVSYVPFIFHSQSKPAHVRTLSFEVSKIDYTCGSFVLEGRWLRKHATTHWAGQSSLFQQWNKGKAART